MVARKQIIIVWAVTYAAVVELQWNYNNLYIRFSNNNQFSVVKCYYSIWNKFKFDS